jgi:integrase
MAKKRATGEGTLRHRADGRWESAITIGYKDNGQPDRKYFYGKTQKEVKEKVEKWQEMQKQSCTSGILKKEYTFIEWSEFWFENHKDDITPTTQENYKYTMRILQNYFGNKPISEFLAYDIETFLKQTRKEGRSDSYLSTCRGLLHHIFRKAAANRLIDHNPVALADKMKSRDPVKKKEAFTADEVKLLMVNLSMDRIGISIRLMLGTGMRSQEILALEPRHIEEDGSIIYIEQAINMVKGTAVVGRPKSRDSYRKIPVPPNLRKYAILLRSTDKKFVWEAGKQDQPCNPSHFRDEFKKALAKVEGVRILTPHSCRHTYVSQLQALGVDLQTIQSIVGHADVDMTEHYLHVQEPKRLEAVDLFSKVFGIPQD